MAKQIRKRYDYNETYPQMKQPELYLIKDEDKTEGVSPETRRNLQWQLRALQSSKKRVGKNLTARCNEAKIKNVSLAGDGTSFLYEYQNGIEEQKVEALVALNFRSIFLALREERELQNCTTQILNQYPIYQKFLKHIDGVSLENAADVLSRIDIHLATYRTNIYQYAGLNAETNIAAQIDIPKSKFRVTKHKAHFEYQPKEGSTRIIAWQIPVETVKGDEKTSDYVCPYNPNLKAAIHVMTQGIMYQGVTKQEITYDEYITTPSAFRSEDKEKEKYYRNIPINNYAKRYYDRKHQQCNSEKMVLTHLKGKKGKHAIMWKDTTDGHRHADAFRVVKKMIIADIYEKWRAFEGLEVFNCYEEAKLGMKHSKPILM